MSPTTHSLLSARFSRRASYEIGLARPGALNCRSPSDQSVCEERRMIACARRGSAMRPKPWLPPTRGYAVWRSSFRVSPATAPIEFDGPFGSIGGLGQLGGGAPDTQYRLLPAVTVTAGRLSYAIWAASSLRWTLALAEMERARSSAALWSVSAHSEASNTIARSSQRALCHAAARRAYPFATARCW